MNKSKEENLKISNGFLESINRSEALFLNGLAWGIPNTFNFFNPTSIFPCNLNQFVTYEALFMYNQLTSDVEPLIGKSYKWNNDNSLTIELDARAHWNNETPLTSADVAYTFLLGKKYQCPWSNFMQFIEDIQIVSPNIVKMIPDKSKYNRLIMLTTLVIIPIHPKTIWEKFEHDSNFNIELIREIINNDAVGSGPYKIYDYNDVYIILKRDDNYWGKALFGKLPEPKYLVHTRITSNEEGRRALEEAKVDYSQLFIPNIWLSKEKSPNIKTYFDNFPYYLASSKPTIIFNLSKKGLDNVSVRKAIALCIDYKKIQFEAVSGYTDDIIPGINLNNDAETKYIDYEKIKYLLWTTDIEAANNLLDSIGTKVKEDGIRVMKDGTRLGPYELTCPVGWTDYNTTLEIVADSAKKIGIEMKTNFVGVHAWLDAQAYGQFDIILNNPGSLNPGMLWDRARSLMLSEGVPPIGEATFWNWGRFKNARADEIINIIPTIAESDFDKLKELYTELNIIYLQNIPSIQLMYRPLMYYTVNENYWYNFPDAHNNITKIPPMSCTAQSGIRMLYEIKSRGN